MNRSTIATIYKKERIEEHVKSAMLMQSIIVSKKRGKLIGEMEKKVGKTYLRIIQDTDSRICLEHDSVVSLVVTVLSFTLIIFLS